MSQSQVFWHSRRLESLATPPQPAHQPRVRTRAAATKQADPATTPSVVQIRSGRETIYGSVEGRLVPAAGRPPSLAQGQEQFVGRFKSLYLPDGYPDSVSDDYISYQIWTVPAHITGWLSHSLTTSSLLKAVGISAGPVGATAAAAAIKWIIKDGIGAFGRFFVGGRLGLEFDADPRRWRMVAELLTTVGLALEVATTISPSSFLLLAGSGNLAKAVGKGMGKPVFRVIQTHFAADNNVGAVAAKEEVWEVTGQLAGYIASVAVLQALEGAGSWETVVGVWALVQGVHVAFRYKALSTLRFSSLSQKRCAALVTAHVAGQRLPSVAAVNAQESLVLPASAVRPCAEFGCSLEEAFGSGCSAQHVAQHLELFSGLPYVLVQRGGLARVLIKEGASARDMVKAMWQAAWLEQHCSSSSSGSGGGSSSSTTTTTTTALMAASIDALHKQYDSFTAEAAAQGWDMQQAVFTLGPYRIRDTLSAASAVAV